MGREGSQCRTIGEACEFLEAAPKDNDPLEYIFGDLLETFTQSETAVLAALAHFSLPARVEWIAEVAGIPEAAARTALEDLSDRALLIANDEAQTFFLPPLAASFLRRKRPEAITRSGRPPERPRCALALENGWKNYERFPRLEAEWAIAAAAALVPAGRQ